VLAGAEIDVDPRDRLRDEAREKARAQDMVAGILDAALLDVGDVALQELVVVVVHREGPDSLAAVGAGFL
jgi:hypothetical protein